MSIGPDGKPCGQRTRGYLSPQSVRIAALRVAGQETHRRRDEEAVVGWDVQAEQEVLARYCRAPGCSNPLAGRQREWCTKHKRYSGRRRGVVDEGRPLISRPGYQAMSWTTGRVTTHEALPPGRQG